MMTKKMERKKGKKSLGRGMSNGIAAGIDLGDSESLVTVLSPVGDVADRFTFPMNDEGYTLFAGRVPRNARVAFEATGMAYPVFRTLKGLGYDDITVAHPKELAWIVKSKKKNDKADSLKIAKLHMAGMLPEAHLLDREEQVFRDLLIQRVKLGVEIGRLKNTVISYFKREGVYNSLPESEDNFSAARRHAILSFDFGDARDLVVKTMMERIEFMEEQCSPIEVIIKRFARESDDVKLLMTIPGVSYYLASLICSYIRDVNRFPSFDHLASFFGIIPESWDSANVKRRGRMSKDGPSIARWALSVMVDAVMLRNKLIKTYYLHEKERTKSGKYARVLTMKKLLRMVHHMLKTRQRWKWENESLTERKLSNLEGGGAVA
jgi:transposase